MSMKINAFLAFFLLSMSSVAHTQSFYPIKHMIANQTKDVMFYHFHFLGDAACDSSDSINPAHLKQINCKSGGLFKPGTYVLEFEQVYFYGKRKVRCSGSKTYQMGEHKKLAIWKLSKRCQLDVIET
ncbi:MAG: hypothetical protein K0U37_03100 [Gammaproteobacteria bacterium]|nr:hypothetical protein [Gammaproteobacteria bacterium]